MLAIIATIGSQVSFEQKKTEDCKTLTHSCSHLPYKRSTLLRIAQRRYFTRVLGVAFRHSFNAVFLFRIVQGSDGRGWTISDSTVPLGAFRVLLLYEYVGHC